VKIRKLKRINRRSTHIYMKFTAEGAEEGRPPNKRVMAGMMKRGTLGQTLRAITTEKPWARQRQSVSQKARNVGSEMD
jgi:hypothetical protein